MKPAGPLFPEYRFPVDFSRLQRRDGGVAAIGAAKCRSYSKPAFREIQTVADGSANAVVIHPSNQRRIDSSLANQVLQERTDGIPCKSSHERGFESKASLQPSRNVVFPASFADCEVTRGPHPILPGIKTQHHFAQADKVPTALTLRPDGERHVPPSRVRQIYFQSKILLWQILIQQLAARRDVPPEIRATRR